MNASQSRWIPRLLLTGAVLLALAVVVALVIWWFNTHIRIERTINLPPQGEAAYNPLYLLRQALQADGVDARSRRYLQLDGNTLMAEDTVLLYGDPRQLTGSEMTQLLDWAAQGGHLVVRLPLARRSEAVASTEALLDMLGIGWMPVPVRFCHRLQFQDTAQEMMFCADDRFMSDEHPDVAWGDPENGYAFARLPWGRGAVDVFSQLDFLHNLELERPGRAALARQLLAPNYGNGTVHLIYGRQLPSLWQIVFEQGRMAWLPLLLALAAWLWMRMPRFGPLRPAPVPVRRALFEHVGASGEYLYRYGRADVLLAALREAFLLRLRRRDPWAANLQGAAQIVAIAARTGTPIADVADALDAEPRGMNSGQFRYRAALLIEMMR